MPCARINSRACLADRSGRCMPNAIAARDARHPADGHRPRRADAMGQRSRKERPKRRHSHEHHRVHRYHAAAQLVGHHRLHHRVRRRHLHHHGEPHRHQQHHRQPEHTRERKQDQAHAESAGADRNHTCPSPSRPPAPPGSARPAARRRRWRPSACPALCAPPCRIWLANTGISTAYGMPTRLTSPSSSRMARIGAASAHEAESFQDVLHRRAPCAQVRADARSASATARRSRRCS